MTLIHPQDEQTLQRWLGLTLPDKLREECQLRTRMFHSAGESGPLGARALISLVRSLGLSPPKVQESPEKTHWRGVPADGTVNVEAYFFGQWMPGTYLGILDHGMLAVRLVDDPYVKECRADIVRLAVTPYDNLSVEEPAPPAALQVAALDEGEDDIPDTEVLDEEEQDVPVPALKRPAVVHDEPDEPAENDEDELPETDWSTVECGAGVWVDEQNDIKDGKFIKVEPDGSLLVRPVDEEVPRKFPAQSVTLAAGVSAE